jgi:hypothetical protein
MSCITVLYVPTSQLEERFGTDGRPLADYVDALKARVAAILSATEPPQAPECWTDAAQATRSKMIIPPDDLFRILWPD